MSNEARKRAIHRKRQALAMAAAMLSLAGVLPLARAVHIDASGAGQVLVFPYYTVNGNQQTQLTITNTTESGKAIKVRFHEGRDSRTALEFNVYLSPFDVWSGTVFSLAGGAPDNPANLLTNDNSCTVPSIKTNTSLPQLPDGRRYLPFQNLGFSGVNDDAGPNTLDRTREGHFELIEMGEVNDNDRGTLSAIVHSFTTGIPSDCPQVVEAWNSGGANHYWLDNPNNDLSVPRGGLTGLARIIDPLSGTMMSYNAVALGTFSDIVQHTSPTAAVPNLASAHDRSPPGTVVARVFKDGQQFDSYYPSSRAIDAVSAVLAQDQLLNEFSADLALGTTSEWIVSFPTKYAYVDQAMVGTVALPPFTEIFPIVPTPENNGSAKVDTGLNLFNREELENLPLPCVNSVGTGCGRSLPPPPGPPPGPSLLWATNVLSFNQPNAVNSGSAVLGSRLPANVEIADSRINSGWARLILYASASQAAGSLINLQRLRPDLNGISWQGLPAVGFLATKYSNRQASPGLLANYTRLSRHRFSNGYQINTVPDQAVETPAD